MRPLVLLLVLLKSPQQCNLHNLWTNNAKVIEFRTIFFLWKIIFKWKKNYKKFGITPTSATIVLGWATLQKIEDTLTNNRGSLVTIERNNSWKDFQGWVSWYGDRYLLHIHYCFFRLYCFWRHGLSYLCSTLCHFWIFS